MKAVVESQFRIAVVAFALTSALLTAGLASADTDHSSQVPFAVASPAAQDASVSVGALYLALADPAPELGADEHDRAPGIGGKNLRQQRFRERAKRSMEESKANAPKAADAAKGEPSKADNSKPADVSKSKPAEADKSKPAEVSKSKPAEADQSKPAGKSRLWLKRQERADDPKDQTPSEAPKSDKPVKEAGKSSSDADSNGKSTSGEQAPLKKPSERHRFHWEDRP